jgi:hypothetical protein
MVCKRAAQLRIEEVSGGGVSFRNRCVLVGSGWRRFVPLVEVVLSAIDPSSKAFIRMPERAKGSVDDGPTLHSGGRPAKHHVGQPSRAIIRTRIGFRTKNAKTAATTLSADATMNTAVQPPVAAVSTLPSGTRSAAVPLAV